MNKFDIYEVVTQKIIDRLEAGVVPWRMPWKNANGMPRNLITGRPYHGINLWLLICLKYDSPFYMTFDQVKSLNGNVKKGERSTMVVFWKLLESEDKNGDIKKTPYLRYYNIFNLTQTEGIDVSKIPATEAHDHDFNPITGAESLVYNWRDCPDIELNHDSAYYAPLIDKVCMPDPRTFFKDEEYYSTLFHELVHSTGHLKRLGRHEKTGDHRFGSKDYSQEELVAEMGAAFLCGITSIEPATIDNSAAYIKSWIRKFKDDPKVLVMAAAQAQKAVDYILENQKDLSPACEEAIKGADAPFLFDQNTPHICPMGTLAGQREGSLIAIGTFNSSLGRRRLACFGGLCYHWLSIFIRFLGCNALCLRDKLRLNSMPS